MCTSLALRTFSFYFGRNMDLDYDLHQRVIITPRQFTFRFRQSDTVSHHPAIIGMGVVVDDYPLYAEACNESGLCVAALNFPEFCAYAQDIHSHGTAICPFEFIPAILTRCHTVDEAEALLRDTVIIDDPLNSQIPNTPLHWHIADRHRSLVAEPLREGLRLYANPLEILTNSPPFEYHMTHLRQYMRMSPDYPIESFCDPGTLTPYGLGFGSIGLPGDPSSSSRFVRMAYNKSASVELPGKENSIAHFFHLLDSVAVVNGVARTENGAYQRTLYSCCIDAAQGEYLFKSYTNQQITTVRLQGIPLDTETLREFPVPPEQQIHYMN
ncbi:MAG: choloylglycine hydrolase [Christensenellales bacterium]|nr:choloylglycine hydrolase [Christensenellales bacterium]